MFHIIHHTIMPQHLPTYLRTEKHRRTCHQLLCRERERGRNKKLPKLLKVIVYSLRTYLPTHLPTYSPTYLLTYLPTHSLTYLPTYLPTYHLPSYLLTHSLTYLPTYLPTVPPTYQGFVYLTKRYTGPEAHWHSSSFRRHRSTLQIHPNMLFVGKIPSYYLTNIPQVEQHLWSHHFVF